MHSHGKYKILMGYESPQLLETAKRIFNRINIKTNQEKRILKRKREKEASASATSTDNTRKATKVNSSDKKAHVDTDTVEAYVAKHANRWHSRRNRSRIKRESTNSAFLMLQIITWHAFGMEQQSSLDN